MRFVVRKDLLADTGAVHEAKVIGRYINGWLVEMGEDEQVVMSEDIEVLEISDQEKNAKLIV